MDGLSINTRPSLPDLPEDVFLLILANMDAWDMVRCQKVSKAWRHVFLAEEYLRIILKKYPFAREVQALLEKGALSSHSAAALGTDLREVFERIASRYYHLTHGMANSVTKYKLAASEQFSHWYPVSQWDYHESQPGGRLYYENATHISRLGGKPYLFRPTFWTYDDGLLVFAPGEMPTVNMEPQLQEAAGTAEQANSELWPPVPSMAEFKEPQELAGASTLVLLDIATGKTFPVPFSMTGRVIRNMRLKSGTLVIEWAQKDPFHKLNESEMVHRHFANCFDVQHNSSSEATEWKVTPRSELKMHFLGLPLNHRDRFFSTHTATHYAVYFWRPNRSMYTGDEELPIESLFVWDISHASTYQPSSDPAGKHQPRDLLQGPHVVARLSFRELDHLGIRQHSDISLMALHLDSRARTITFRENVCVAGQGYFDPAERLWCARTTSFPFDGLGPHLNREWDGNLPPYRGHCTMESTDVEDPEKWFLPIMDVVDTDADVRFSLVETCFTGQIMENRTVVRVSALERHATMQDKLVTQIAGMGRIAGDERWLVGQNGLQELVVLKF